MTDATQPPGHLDDLRLSAAVDGEASPEEVLHTEGCDRCAARLASMQAAVALVASPVTPPDAAGREAAVAGAVAALPDERPVLLVGRGRPPRATPRWLLPAAAAVTALALAGAVLGALGRDASDEQAASLADDAADTQATTAPTEAGGSDEAIPSGAADGSAPVALGPESDLAALVTTELRQRADLPSSRSEEADEGFAASPPDQALLDIGTCDEAIRGREEGLGPLRYHAEATWEGRPALVLAYDDTAAASEAFTRAFVVGRDDCALYRRDTFPRSG